jgi:hypothetical protein
MIEEIDFQTSDETNTFDVKDAVIETLSRQNAMLHQSLDRIWEELALHEYDCGIREVNA